jgi:hypothetical protein
MQIHVVTRKYDNGAWKYESEKIIDHDKSSDRKWLASHCFWAMRNMRKVITWPAGELRTVLESN